jgi:transcriptional regulator with GAF, ATPase, and Fis domain
MTTLELIGSSPKFRALLTEVAKVAPVDSAVLLQGETGTGKKVIARAIHEASPRRNHSFVALNCAAIPGALLESELFGHERGAFTGARAQTKGRFQMADRGTLFLEVMETGASLRTSGEIGAAVLGPPTTSAALFLSGTEVGTQS